VTALDVAGATDAARTGRFARRCDARAKGLGRALYLDPLQPPAAPRNVRVSYGEPRCDRFEDPTCRTRATVTWSPSSGATGFVVRRVDFWTRVVLRPGGDRPSCWTTGKRRPVLVETVAGDTRRVSEVVVTTPPGDGSVPFVTGQQYLVTARNQAGPSAPAASREPEPYRVEGIPRCRR
jgi:hypothetical protein